MFLKEPINIVLCHELLWKNHQHCSKHFTATYLSKWRDDQNVHVLKFLKAEGLSTLFYQFQNCCGISKENRGIINIVLPVSELLRNLKRKQRDYQHCSTSSEPLCPRSKPWSVYYHHGQPQISEGPVLNKTGGNVVATAREFRPESRTPAE